ncbi:hypothetical protein [Paludisphaera sp.]|uniref:hypothetical protein n=1 Tax=Paludisphaera sp. TaxID=2017432 RepID=UPI00301D2DCD
MARQPSSDVRPVVRLSALIVAVFLSGPALAEGPSEFSWGNFPNEPVEDLKILRPRGIRAFGIAPSGGYAIVSHDDRAVARGDLPPGFGPAFDQLTREGTRITSIAFGPDGGWIILFDQGSRFGNIPPGCEDALRDMASRNERPLSAALGDGGAWVVVSDRTFSTGNISPDFNARLQSFAQNGGVEFVSLAPSGGGSVFANGTRYNTRSVPVDCDRRISEASVNGDSIDMVVFTKEGGWIVISSRR